MRIVAALLMSAAIAMPAAAETSWGMKARTGSSACAPTIEGWLKSYGKAVIGRPVERTVDVLASDVEWSNGERQRVVVARQGERGYCIVLSGPIPTPGA